MTYMNCDGCGKLTNWVFPDPQLWINGERLYFCSDKCMHRLQQKIANKKLRKRGIL